MWGIAIGLNLGQDLGREAEVLGRSLSGRVRVCFFYKLCWTMLQDAAAGKLEICVGKRDGRLRFWVAPFRAGCVCVCVFYKPKTEDQAHGVFPSLMALKLTWGAYFMKLHG